MINNTLRAVLCITSICFLQACVGTVVGAAVDLTIEAAKVPFKVGGAVIDVVTDDDEEEEKDKKKNKDKD